MEDKRAKELFVTGHNGMPFSELIIFSAIIPACFYLRSSIDIFLDKLVPTRCNPYIHAMRILPLDLAVDFMFLVVPVIIAVYRSEMIGTTLMILIALGAKVGVFARAKQGWAPPPPPTTAAITSSGAPNSPVAVFESKQYRSSAVSLFRVGIMLATCIGILGVDFPLFPRRFAKTEEFGFSLMDLGTGLFIASHGLTASRHGLQRETQKKQGGRWQKPLLQTAVLLALGLARTFSVKAANYQEHVSEYGTHWNFFLTLAFVTGARSFLIPESLSGTWMTLFGLVLGAGYQFALLPEGLDWANWILHAPRGPDLISHNREGLLSSLGYLSISLLSSGVGGFLFKQEEGGRIAPSGSGRSLFAAGFMALAVAVFAVMGALHNWIQPVSRRMANGGYICLSVGLTCFFLAAFMLVQAAAVLVPPMRSKLVDAVNRNALLTFLVANLLTGAVNLSIDTLHTPNSKAFLILSGYMFLVCWVSVAWDSRPLALRTSRSPVVFAPDADAVPCKHD